MIGSPTIDGRQSVRIVQSRDQDAAIGRDHPGRWLGGVAGAVASLAVGIVPQLFGMLGSESGSADWTSIDWTEIGLFGVPVGFVLGRAFFPQARSGGWSSALWVGADRLYRVGWADLSAAPVLDRWAVALAPRPGGGVLAGTADGSVVVCVACRGSVPDDRDPLLVHRGRADRSGRSHLGGPRQSGPGRRSGEAPRPEGHRATRLPPRVARSRRLGTGGTACDGMACVNLG